MATVLLTGASGFLGVHTTRALLDAGHRVRGFVRTPEKYDEALAAVGLDTSDPRIELADGDMEDADETRKAAEGCEAVVHTAATISMSRPDRDEVIEQNATGTRTVLQTGIDAGCRRLVHVSSTVALARPDGVVLDHRSPLGPGFGPYSDSKVAAERVARELREAGAAVTVVHPGAILGPDDPSMSDNNDSVLSILRGRLPVWPRGSMHYVDVRDVAAVLVAAVEQPDQPVHEHGDEPDRAGHEQHGPGRYLVPGHSVPNLHGPLAELTGRRLPVVTLPARLMQAGAIPGYLTGWKLLPDQVEPVRLLACANPVDASATTRDLGVTARPLADTLTDTVRWLVAAGHLTSRQAGRVV